MTHDTQWVGIARAGEAQGAGEIRKREWAETLYPLSHPMWAFLPVSLGTETQNCVSNCLYLESLSITVEAY